MPRSRGGKEEYDTYTGIANMDSTFSLLKMMVVLIVFVSGVVIGLTSSSHINSYFMSPPEPSYFINHISTAINKTFKNNYDNVQGCRELDCLMMDNFIHPKNLMHSLSDEELFWRASMVPLKRKYPYNRLPKVAFMFLTRGPLPMLPLWEKFFQGHENLFSIYVHALPGFDLNVSVSSAFYGRQIPSQDVQWGTVELADAERRLLANALLDFSNERFVLLSESCIPVIDFGTVYKYLIGSEHSFLDSYDDPSRYGRGRYSRKMLPQIKLYQWRKGSQWFEVQRSLAISIVSDTIYYTIFRKYCKPSCYPDEHYLPTFLTMFHGSELANRSVTFVDWSFGGPHPASYGEANITHGFIRDIRNNNGTICSYNSERASLCYLFARKFAPTALGSLLNLSSEYMGF